MSVKGRVIFTLTMFAVVNSLIIVGQVSPAQTFPDTHNAFLSVQDYDKQKNCTADLDKRPTSIEYLTHFNCGKVSQGVNGQTIREFTLVIEENQNITISNAGHYFDAWTFNGTVPGPSMRMTEGDLVKINVINSKESKHTHSMHMHSIHTAEMDGVAVPLSSNSQGQLHEVADGHNTTSMGDVYESGMILPGKSFTYEFVAQPYGVYPYHCHVNPVADHINRGLYGMMIIRSKRTKGTNGRDGNDYEWV